jgi:hypothetical protein
MLNDHEWTAQHECSPGPNCRHFNEGSSITFHPESIKTPYGVKISVAFDDITGNVFTWPSSKDSQIGGIAELSGL